MKGTNLDDDLRINGHSENLTLSVLYFVYLEVEAYLSVSCFYIIIALETVCAAVGMCMSFCFGSKWYGQVWMDIRGGGGFIG